MGATETISFVVIFVHRVNKNVQKQVYLPDLSAISCHQTVSARVCKLWVFDDLRRGFITKMGPYERLAKQSYPSDSFRLLWVEMLYGSEILRNEDFRKYSTTITPLTKRTL